MDKKWKYFGGNNWKRENFFLRVLKYCWIMLFLVFNFKIEETRDDFVLNFKKRVSKRKKILKISKNKR